MGNTLENLLSKDTNVSDCSRIVSVLAGTALIMKVFNGKKAAIKTISGGYLLYRGISGHWPGSDQSDVCIVYDFPPIL